jgi:hypothetical protein
MIHHHTDGARIIREKDEQVKVISTHALVVRECTSKFHECNKLVDALLNRYRWRSTWEISVLPPCKQVCQHTLFHELKATGWCPETNNEVPSAQHID